MRVQCSTTRHAHHVYTNTRSCPPGLQKCVQYRQTMQLKHWFWRFVCVYFHTYMILGAQDHNKCENKHKQIAKFSDVTGTDLCVTLIRVPLILGNGRAWYNHSIVRD